METRKKVLDAAKKMNYRPNRRAASLVTRHTRTIGITVANIKNAFFADLVSGAEACCTEHDFSLIICNADDRKEQDIRYVNLMIEQGIEGVILSFSDMVTLEDARKIIKDLTECGIEISVIDFWENFEEVHNIRMNNLLGGYLAAKHLLELNHRRIGCIAGKMQENGSAGALRVAGYQKALKEAGISSDESLILAGDFHIDTGYRFAREMLSKNVTGIVCGNDLIAYGVYKLAREVGILIPETLSVVGYDDIAYSDFFVPGLTTVRQPAFDMGYFAAEKIINSINGAEHVKGTETVFRPRMIVRKSTKKYEN